MIIIKTDEEVKILRECGRRLAEVLYKLKDLAKPGISAKELDRHAEKMIRNMGDKPAFLNYQPKCAAFPFPATLCVSINNESVHGIPGDKKILREGDIVGLDLGINHKGLFTDMAITVPVGIINDSEKKLIDVTEKALYKGIKAARPGNRIGDIGQAIQSFVNSRGKYGIVKILGGHGVGRDVHEDPSISNLGPGGVGPKIVKNMVIAIEPIINLGSCDVTLCDDNYTFCTIDGKKSAHFEHTILITDNGPEILTTMK